MSKPHSESSPTKNKTTYSTLRIGKFKDCYLFKELFIDIIALEASDT